MKQIFYNSQEKVYESEFGKKKFYKIRNVSKFNEINVRISNVCIPRTFFYICLSDGKKCLEKSSIERILIKTRKTEPILLIIPLLKDKPHNIENIPQKVLFKISIQKNIFGIPEDSFYFVFIIVGLLFHSLFLCKIFSMFFLKEKKV